MGLAGTHPSGLPFFCPNGDHLTQPPPAHMGIPPYGTLDAGKAAAAAGEYQKYYLNEGFEEEECFGNSIKVALLEKNYPVSMEICNILLLIFIEKHNTITFYLFK